MDGGRIVNAYRFVRFDNLAASLGFLPLQGIAQQSFAGRAGPGKSPKILVTARSAPAYLQLANIWMIPAGDPRLPLEALVLTVDPSRDCTRVRGWMRGGDIVPFPVP